LKAYLIFVMLLAACWAKGPLANTPTHATLTAPEGTAGPILEAWEHLNQTRAKLGLAPVTLDAEMSRASELRAKYLKSNKGKPEVGDLLAHEEVVGSEGYTTEGANAGKNAVIA
jgi:hypothetical protein